jgi:hypothetical protein
MSSSAKHKQVVSYRLQPPCAGRLILTRWALTLLAFPLVWCVAMLAALPRSIIAVSRQDHTAGTGFAALQAAHARSICWTRWAAGWDTPKLEA